METEDNQPTNNQPTNNQPSDARREIVERSLESWLERFTWCQDDGRIDFHQPRARPEGLPVHERERSPHALGIIDAAASLVSLAEAWKPRPGGTIVEELEETRGALRAALRAEDSALQDVCKWEDVATSLWWLLEEVDDISHGFPMNLAALRPLRHALSTRHRFARARQEAAGRQPIWSLSWLEKPPKLTRQVRIVDPPSSANPAPPPPVDAAFEASPVPEPESVALMRAATPLVMKALESRPIAPPASVKLWEEVVLALLRRNVAGSEEAPTAAYAIRQADLVRRAREMMMDDEDDEAAKTAEDEEPTIN